MTVKPKKHFGQHFLKEESIANKIVNALEPLETSSVLEIGPGMGVLTKYLLELPQIDLKVIELDKESVEYLEINYPNLRGRIISGDFLQIDLSQLVPPPYSIIGNFPYNISSQILFNILEHKEDIPMMVGMFQKEVADRVVSKPGSKVYGILSVLIQAFYFTEYLFTVEPGSFNPPPKVRSAVIRMKRHDGYQLGCDEKEFFKVVKMAFNQRRKTLRNALSGMGSKQVSDEIFDKRAEQLSVNDFVRVTNLLIKA
jgi:16S rRNA (adenine1518-N6/adenine1519-N6)-dimethyltransferase